MDSYEATRVVLSRIQNLDPENASRIMGLLLIQDHGEKEMIRLAFGPESLLHSVILKARRELGILSSTSSTPPSPSPFTTPSTYSLSRQNSSNSSSSRLVDGGISNLPSPLSIPSWPASNFADELTNPATNGVSNSPMNSAAPPFYGRSSETDIIDEFHLQDQFSFLNDASPRKNSDFLYSDSGSSPIYGGNWRWAAAPHRRSSSANDVCLGVVPDDAIGWKPCLYFARGYCKNGASCRFVHDGSLGEADMAALSKLELIEQFQELFSSKSAHQQTLAAASQLITCSPGLPYSNSKSMNFLPLQDDSPRVASASALLMGEEMNKFGRSRNDFSMNGMVNPGSRQIYLTFPADSTFREEDVSNYFSIYGPVQDVRIPYQQKRMFGFVTFVYPETVKLILAKGNPHFVCDARVLVKPYKEKGKVPDKFRKQQQQQMERGEFSACGSPTGFDSRDPFELQIGARMLYTSRDILWRRKLEEQADLQEAIELQNRRLMGLQLLDVKRNHHHHHHHRALSTGAAIPSPTHSPNFLNHHHLMFPLDRSSPEQEHNPISTFWEQTENHSEKEEKDSLDLVDGNSNVNVNDKVKICPSHQGCDLPESLEHNLPDNIFASPKASVDSKTAFSSDEDFELDKNTPLLSAPPSQGNNNNNLITSPLLPATSTLDMASLKSCYFQVPRFASDHGAIGM